VVIKNNVLNNCYGGIGLGNNKDSPKFKGKLFISQNKFNGITEAAIKNHENWSKHRLKNNLLNGEILSKNVK
jgi:hypothetical protein